MPCICWERAEKPNRRTTLTDLHCVFSRYSYSLLAAAAAAADTRQLLSLSARMDASALPCVCLQIKTQRERTSISSPSCRHTRELLCCDHIVEVHNMWNTRMFFCAAARCVMHNQPYSTTQQQIHWPVSMFQDMLYMLYLNHKQIGCVQH